MIFLGNLFLGRNIGVKVRKNVIYVGSLSLHTVNQGIVNLLEQLAGGVVGAVNELVHNLCQLGISVQIFLGIVAMLMLNLQNLVRGETEDKGIFGTCLLYNLDVGTVHGSQGQGSVHHELHVACSRGFLASSGNLLGNVGGWEKLFCQAYTVIFYKDNPKLALYTAVIVDSFCHCVDKLDDSLCTAVTRSGLCSEDVGSGWRIEVWILQNAVVQIHDVEYVQQLSLVLVESLDLHIKDRVWIQELVLGNFQVMSQLLLVCSLIPGLLKNDDGKPDREEYTVDPSKLADTKEEDFDILEYEEYLKYDRTIQYCYTSGVQVSVNDKTLSNYDASFALIYNLIGTLIAGDSDAYNELVHEDVGHFDSFTQQQVYDVVITKYSESAKQSETGSTYAEFVYVVEYKIHENNGTYRKDIESDACRAQYFVINDSTGELLIMDIFSKTHAN